MTFRIEIPPASITFKYSRSSGPGGQNVNKVSTKATLLFDWAGCDTLSDVEKSRIRKNLAGRFDKNGFLSVTSQKFRTQSANRQSAVEKLNELLTEAIKEKPVRKKTRIPFSASRKRLESKRKRSTIKQLRTEKDFGF
jgi:ribosome-associated protein